MGLRCRRLSILASLVYGLFATMFATMTAQAVETFSAHPSQEGISFSLPEGWQPREEDGVALWVNDGTGATVSLSSRSRYTEVSRTLVEGVKRSVEGSMRQRRSIERFQLEHLSVASVDGLPAYRLLASIEVKGQKVKELLYIISGRETCLLAFSSRAGSFAEELEGFERLMRSVKLLHRPGIAQQMPAELCCGILGAAGILGALLRRGRGRKK